MQLNGAELNAVSLNGAAVLGKPAVTVEPIISVLWGARVLLGGVDISANLTGSLRIEREEGAATLADFVLSLDAGAVNPAAYIGKSVEVYYQHWSGSAWVEHLRFAGQVIRPQYSMQERLLSCDCSDRLQDAIEALTVTQVDTLAGGQWSADLFESPEGRSRWDYAQERMSTHQPAEVRQRRTAGDAMGRHRSGVCFPGRQRAGPVDGLDTRRAERARQRGGAGAGLPLYPATPAPPVVCLAAPGHYRHLHRWRVLCVAP